MSADPTDPAPDDGAAIEFDEEFDGGDMSCGALAIELRIRVRAMQPGQVLHLISQDPGAPADIPAWSRLTGNQLLRDEHPHYWIRRKQD